MYRITILAALFVLAARSFASPLIEARQMHNLVFDTPQRDAFRSASKASAASVASVIAASQQAAAVAVAPPAITPAPGAAVTNDGNTVEVNFDPNAARSDSSVVAQERLAQQQAAPATTMCTPGMISGITTIDCNAGFHWAAQHGG